MAHDDRENLWNEIHRLQEAVAKLYELFTEPDPGPMRRKRIPEGLRKAAREAVAKKARIGRAAKRHGMSLDAWVKKYGMVDMLPGPEAQEKLPGTE